MQIVLAEIPEDGVTLVGECPPSVLKLEKDRFIRAEIPVSYELFAQRLPQELVLRGRLQTDLELLCARCAEFFSTTLTDSSFLRAYDVSAQPDAVDVGDDIRDAILLEIPSFPLCSADCKGLCPRCGRNLNRGPCGCPPPKEESVWGGLDQLNL